ncbi:uncharacterized protein PAC_17862 [Phialocephala subalpina]|uniref:Uncharacterized protein n=1 Tax=Phialocephala subalpina TaxID=576137 RepID=A0A1L7XSE6_9HELO|nr:uncharacterized protein PAC_17862 [Phialocephala subalpina]
MGCKDLLARIFFRLYPLVFYCLLVELSSDTRDTLVFEEVELVRNQSIGLFVQRATSSGVVQAETHIEAGVAAGFPVDVSLLWSYHHSSDFGAIQICTDQVINESYRQKVPFSRWANNENTKVLLKDCPDIKAHGFFIITSTWSTTDVLTAAWTNPEHHVEIGVKVEVPGMDKLDRGSSITPQTRQEAGFRLTQRKNVVFFGGIHYKFNRLMRETTEVSQLDWESRASGEEQIILSDPQDEKFVYMVQPVNIGDAEVD